MPPVSTLNNTTDEKTEYPAARRLLRPPTHPGDVIKNAFDALPEKLSIRDRAKVIGVSHAALAEVLKGAAAVSEEMDLRVSRYLNREPGLYRKMQYIRDMWFAEKRLKTALAKIVPAERD